MARRRFKRAGFNTKLIMDVGLAGIATRVLPTLVNKFFPLDPTLYAVVGAGGTYVVGSMLKKPDLANAGIALGLVEFVAPMIENLVGGITSSPMVGAGTRPSLNPAIVGAPVVMTKALDDAIRLNDAIRLSDGSYIPLPIARSSREYANGY